MKGKKNISMQAEINKPVKNKIYIGSRVFDVILVIFFILVSIIFIYPFLNVVAVSLSSNNMISTGQVSWFPREFNVMGYTLLFKEANIWGSYLNTLIIAIGFTAVNLVATSLMAYVMMVPDFVFKKLFSILLLITMFFNGGIIPTFLLVKNLGMLDSWWALILPNALSAYNVFIYRSFYKGISNEIREAAMIDGAGDFRILLKIYVPLSKALYATFGMFAVIGIWNSYFDALLYIKNSDLYPIQMVLRQIVFTSGIGSMSDANQMLTNGKLNALNVQYACIIATIGPILIVYPFVQKYFTQGMQVGAVKG